MRSVRADVWVVNSCYTAPETWAAIRYLNNAGLPWVYMNEPVRMRGGTDALKRSVLRKMLSRASGIIGMGTEAQVQYCKIVNRESPSISVPYLPDLNDFLALPQAQPPTNAEPVRFFAAAQLIHRKGLDVLLAACSRLTESGWTLTIAGDGPLRSNLRREFGKRFGSDRVRFIGQIPYKDRANVFAKHHAFVFPSRWDGWGVAPVEAMAAGLPVISSDTVISMREIIREGKNGYLVPSENPQLLAERMQQLIASPHKLSTMGQSARASLADYVPTNGARRLADFLLELTNPNRIDSKEAPQTISPDEPASLTWHGLIKPANVVEHIHKRSRAQGKQAIIDLSLSLRPKFAAKDNRILVYHLVLHEDRSRFSEHLSFLKDHYDFVTAKELAKADAIPITRPQIAITFDDGFKVLMSDALELLEKHNIKATFYVPTGFVSLASTPERAADFSLRAHYYQRPLLPMNDADLRALRKSGHEIGSHGVSHIGLNALSKHAAMCELEESRHYLTQLLGEQVSGFAYPDGHTSGAFGTTSQWVQLAGYDYAVTLKRGPIGSDSDLMRLPREHVEGNWRLRDLVYFLGR